MQNLTQAILSTARKRAKCFLSDRVQPQHKHTELCDLSDELIGCILRNLTFSEKAEAHLVCPRFHNILAKSDPSLRIYGSLSFDLGVELKNENSAWFLTRYLLRRAAGIVDLNIFLDDSGTPNRGHLITFLTMALPQLSAVFALHRVALTLSLQEAGTSTLLEEPLQLPAGQLGVENPQLGTYFGIDYWQCLSGTLRSLDLDLNDYQDQSGPVNLHWVSSLHRLQSLSLCGVDMQVELPPVLSLPSLESCALRYFHSIGQLHADCPFLADLVLEEICDLQLPTGLKTCKNLLSLHLSPSGSHSNPAVEILPTLIGGLPISIQELELIGWGLTALPQAITALQSLRILTLRRNELTALPQLPASLEVLDLQANAFTDIPVSLASMTGLRTLMITSKYKRPSLQIRRPLDPFLGLPKLEQLTLCSQHSMTKPFEVWTAQSLQHLALAEYGIHRSGSKLLLTY